MWFGLTSNEFHLVIVFFMGGLKTVRAPRFVLVSPELERGWKRMRFLGFLRRGAWSCYRSRSVQWEEETFGQYRGAAWNGSRSEAD